MNALYQRLKEMDRDTFERFCFHFLKERHPGADIKRVEGASGDEGADSFYGELGSRPTVWQAKAFPNRIGESQKDQIRKSLKRAVNKLKPRYWVLCLNIDMDIRAHRWWEKLKTSYANKVEMGLMQASHIVAELAHRKTLCELYFPDAVLNVSDLRALVMRTDTASDTQLSNLVEETSEQLIERLKARDARFNYQLVVSPENSPVPAASGMMFSIQTGRTSINAYARDVTALRADPPKVTFQLVGTGIEKMTSFMETGKSQAFEPAELGRISSTIGALEFDDNLPKTLVVGPSSDVTQKVIPFRLTFGRGAAGVVYEYLPFRVNSVGSKEMELFTTSTEPFSLTMQLRASAGEFRFNERATGFSVRSGDKWIRALAALKSDGYFEAYDLAAGKRVVFGTVTLEDGLGYLSGYAAFFRDATELCDHFGVELNLGRPVSPEDVEAFTFLQQLMMGGTLEVGRITGEMEKRRNEDGVPQDVWAGKPRQLRLDSNGRTLSLLDTLVQSGPFSVTVDVSLNKTDELAAKWESAAEGELVEFTWEPRGPATLFQISADRTQ
jgi:hypothetical protein